MERDRPAGPRGEGRRRLQDGVLELLDHATLDDLLRFISVRRLVECTGLSNGAIYKVSRGPATLARTTTLQEAVMIGEPTIRLFERLDGLLAGVEAGDDQTRIQIAEAGAENVLGWSLGSGRTEFTAMLLATATASNEPDVAEVLRDYYDGSVLAFASILTSMMKAWRREPIEDFDADAMAVLSVSLGDGLAMRARFDPRVTPDLIARGLQAVWAGTTRRLGSVDDDLQFRLGFTDDPDPVPPTDQENVEIIAEAVKAIYRRHGWASVTLTSVAGRTGLSRGRIRTLFGDRDGLALAVWNQFVLGLERIVAQGGESTMRALAERYLIAVVERCHEHPEVTESLLRTLRTHDLRAVADHLAVPPGVSPTGGGEGASRDDGRALVPRRVVPVGRILFEALRQQPPASSSEGADHMALLDYATHLCETSMSRAVIMPNTASAEIVRFALDPGLGQGLDPAI